MKTKVEFIKNKDLGRYLQSLDSIRFMESDFLACKTQAIIETFTSLMMGRTIPIGEHQFIDSYGLLFCASKLLSALNEFSERGQVNHVFPFQLFFRRQYKTIDGLIANKLGDPNYKLALWPELGQEDNNEMRKKRKKIRAKIQKGVFKYEDDDLIPIGDRDAAEILHIVRNQFVQSEQGQIFTIYGANSIGYSSYLGILEKGIDRICNWSEEDLIFHVRHQEKIVESGLVPMGLLNYRLIPEAMELIAKINELRKVKLQIDNRSNIRIGQVKNEKIKYREYVNNDMIYEGILEIFDSLYNTTLAKASFAHSESISTARNVIGNPYIQVANALSTMAKNEITDQSDLIGNFFNPSWMQDFSFDLGNKVLAEKLIDSIPWKCVWIAYLDSKWRESVSWLNQTLQKWDYLINNPTTSEQAYFDITHELDDAYNRHIQNISRILAPSGWSFFKDQKTGKMIVEFLPLAGGIATEAAARLMISQVNIDPFWEEVLPLTISGGIGFGINKFVEPVGKWVTKGLIRKTFARLNQPIQ